MSKANDGGPAFPRPHSDDHCEYQANQEWAQQGMSTRTWLAGQALSGVISSSDPHVKNTDIAEVSVAIADAMLEALERSKHES